MSAPLQYSFSAPPGSRTDQQKQNRKAEVQGRSLFELISEVLGVHPPSTDMRRLLLLKSRSASSWYCRDTPSSETTTQSLLLRRKTQPSSLAAPTSASSSGEAAWYTGESGGRTHRAPVRGRFVAETFMEFVDPSAAEEPTLTVLPLRHDRVAQGQSPEEPPAGWTPPSSQLLHQAGSRHVQASAGEGVPAQIHGLQDTQTVSLNSCRAQLEDRARADTSTSSARTEASPAAQKHQTEEFISTSGQHCNERTTTTDGAGSDETRSRKRHQGSEMYLSSQPFLTIHTNTE